MCMRGRNSLVAVPPGVGSTWGVEVVDRSQKKIILGMTMKIMNEDQVVLVVQTVALAQEKKKEITRKKEGNQQEK